MVDCGSHAVKDVDKHDTTQTLPMNEIHTIISAALDKKIPEDTLDSCGGSVVGLIRSRPREVLDLAYQKLNAWPFAIVPTGWRRAYEDASLAKALDMIQERPGFVEPDSRIKRRCIEAFHYLPSTNLTQFVDVLDNGLNISGAPARAQLYASVFDRLGDLMFNETTSHEDEEFEVDAPPSFPSPHQVRRSTHPLTLEEFQTHIDRSRTPFVISNTFDHWPALERWKSSSYLMRLTLGGRRLVPVELGRSYTDEGWGQRFMPFKEFLESYILAKEVTKIGYLAQHDLFAQIPTLRNDISIPDYCYTSPPQDIMKAEKAEQLDEPLLNAWFGPKGTTTPLHTDPYHNILCQVVGYKYVRLYAPDQTDRLYPSGIDGNGVNMDNTSRVDVEYFSKGLNGSAVSPDMDRLNQDFPLFPEAVYVDTVLGPGECLYIPAGWWHYVESLSISFSVSFWWN